MCPLQNNPSLLLRAAPEIRLCHEGKTGQQIRCEFVVATLAKRDGSECHTCEGYDEPQLLQPGSDDRS